MKTGKLFSNFKKWLSLCALIGSSMINTNEVFSQEYSPKSNQIYQLEDQRLLILEKNATYKISKEFDLESGDVIELKVEMQKNSVSRGFIVKDKFDNPKKRITYDIDRDGRMHLNATKWEGGMEKNISEGRHQIPIDPQGNVGRHIIERHKYFPETPKIFSESEYRLNVIPRGGSNLYYKEPESSITTLVPKEGQKFRMNPRIPVRNTIRISGARASSRGLSRLVVAGLADGPEPGPLDALLLLGAVLEFGGLTKNVDIESVFFREDRYNMDYRSHNLRVYLEDPEFFERVTGLTMDTNTGIEYPRDPIDYNSKLPEPYRTNMYIIMMQNPKLWKTTREYIERKFRENKPDTVYPNTGTSSGSK